MTAPPAGPPLDTVTLAAGGSRVEIVPALGGKIASLHLGGREWLWTSDVLPRVAPDGRITDDDSVSYVETADTGGYDECLPTVAACRLPDAVPGYGGLALPDHGELWSRPARTTRVGEAGAVTRWEGRRMPYTLDRTVRVDGAGAVQMRYTLTNPGAEPLPFLWSAHPLLPLTPDTRLELPVAARVRVWAEHGIDLGGAGAEHRWPMLRVAGREVDFTRPAEVARAHGGGQGGGYACKLFLDFPRTRGATARAAVEQGDARLEVELDAAEVPHFGLWINHGGWTPFPGGAPYVNLAFEPCIGAPDALDAALGAWDAAAWLAPGATRAWTLTWRGRRRPAGP